MAVRSGVTYTSTQITSNLTATVKKDVQDHSVGLLRGGTGLNYIKVHYFDQDDPSLDVSNTPSGNAPNSSSFVASEPIGKFYLVNSTTQLIGAFDSIASSLLRLAQ